MAKLDDIRPLSGLGLAALLAGANLVVIYFALGPRADKLLGGLTG
jgi:hypothetical protein